MNFLSRPRLTYANVMSTIALFVALGGASYAASGALAPGSVGRSQLRARAVTPPKLAFAYTSGSVGRSNRQFSIGASVHCSPGPLGKCGPPPGAQDKVIAETVVRLTRPASIMIATNLVVNDDGSQGAFVRLYNDVQGAQLETACATQTVVPGGIAETVSCAGATGVLAAGSYRVDLNEGASGTQQAGVEATAEQAALAWWTLPPGRHGTTLTPPTFIG